VPGGEGVLPGVRIEDEPFVGGQEPVRDESLCDRCELCRLGCRFGAIGADLSVDRIACEGCGLCSRLCPFDAIAMVPRTSGRLFVSRTARGPLVHARLEPGEESSGKLVSRVRQRARTLGAEEGASFLLVDGPPGIGCPAISALGGADLAVLVAQPGVSGLHDLERVLDLTAHFGVRAGVVVNQWDLAPEATDGVRAFAARRGVADLGAVPFDRSVVAAIASARPPVLAASPRIVGAIRGVWRRVLEEIVRAAPRPVADAFHEPEGTRAS
jgi:MinD superfamily P-loop ATPase